jgi:hypothetical protein
LPGACRGLFPKRPAENDWWAVRELILNQDLTHPLDSARTDPAPDDWRMSFSPTDLPKTHTRMPEAI